MAEPWEADPIASGPEPWRGDAMPVPASEMARRNLWGGVGQIGKRMGLALSAPAVIADRIFGTQLADPLFRTLVDPAQANIERARMAPGEVPATQQVGPVNVPTGALAGGAAQAIPMIAEALFFRNAQAPAMAPGAQAAWNTAAPVAAPVTQAMQRGVAPMLEPAAGMASTRTQDLLERGVPAPQAVAAGAAQGTGLLIGGAAPAAMPGALGTRMASGAGFNVAQGMATDAAGNMILADRPDLARDLMDPASRALDVALGLGFGTMGPRGQRPDLDAVRATYADPTLMPVEPRAPAPPMAAPVDPLAAAKAVTERIYGGQAPDAPQAPELGLVPKNVPQWPRADLDEVQARVPVPPEWQTEGATREEGQVRAGRRVMMDEPWLSDVAVMPPKGRAPQGITVEEIPAREVTLPPEAPAPRAEAEGPDLTGYRVEELPDAGTVRVDQGVDQEALPPSPRPGDQDTGGENLRVDAEAGRGALADDIGEGAPAGPRTLGERLTDPGSRTALERMAKEAGWEERGGRVVRDESTGQVVDRTKWVARSEWFQRMRADMGRAGLANEGEIQRAVEKAVAGGKLTPREQRTVAWMLDEVDDFNRAWDAEAAKGVDDPYAADLALRDAGLSRDDAADFDLVVRASEIDEAAVERLAIQHPDGGPEFTRGIEEIVNGRGGETTQAQPGAAARAGGEAVPQAPAQGVRGAERAETRGAGEEPAAGARLSRQADDAVMDRAGEQMFDLERPTPDVLKMREAAATRESDARAAREGAPPPEDFGLTGSDRPADVAEAKGQGTLYGGIPLKPIAEAMKMAFGDAKQFAEGFSGLARDFKEWAKAKSVGTRTPLASRVLRRFFDSSAADIRGELRRWKSPTANKVVDMLHNASGEAFGKAEATGEVYHSAVMSQANIWSNRLAKAFESLSESDLQQAVAQVRSGKIGVGKVGKAAAEMRATLDDALKTMKAAGVDVGDVKNYFPREFDMRRVLSDPDTFMRAVEQAYREQGMSAKDAQGSARALHDTIAYGESGWFSPETRNIGAPFLKERVFGPQVDQAAHPLNKFLVDDPVASLGSYFHRAAQRTEIAKRFGDKFSKWDDMVKSMRGEGAAEIIPKVREFVALATGVKGAGAGLGVRASSTIRTVGALMLLEKAVLSSIQETLMPALRTGNLMDAGRSVVKTLDSLFVKSGGAAERKAFAEDLGLIADRTMDHVQFERLTAGDPISAAQSRALSRFFYGTGLTPLTNAQITSSANIGQVLIRRLAKEMAGKPGKFTTRALADLGVPEAQAKTFSAFVLKANDGMPAAGQLTGPMGDLYRQAIRRMVRETVMQPDRSMRPGWQNHPLGQVVGQIQAFNYAFWENVIKRQGRMVKEAATGEGYSMAERARLVMPTLFAPMLYAAAYAIGEARDEVLGDPKWRNAETGVNKLLKTFDRGTPIAPLSGLVNLVTNARYQQSAAQMFLGPVPGKAVNFIDALVRYEQRNSENTNSAERALAKQGWDVFLEPTMQWMMTGLPLTPAWGLARILGPSIARKGFTNAVAGPEQDRDGPYGGKKAAVY